MRTVTFIVSAGRSGSTALSRILNRHPDILSISELTQCLRLCAPLGPVTGAEFWRTLAEPNMLHDAIIRSGIDVPEFAYLRLPGTRYSADLGGIPALALMTLPHLDDDPDRTLDLLAAEVPSWPRRPARDHYRQLIDRLASHYGGFAAVERSGNSLDSIPWMHACFPEARFVHLHRDGPDTAMSMRAHPLFRQIWLLRDSLHRHPRVAEVIDWLLASLPRERVDHLRGFADAAAPGAVRATGMQMSNLIREAAAALGFDSPEKLPDRFRSLIPEDLVSLLSQEFDPALLMERDMDLGEFGALWSESIVRGLRNLAALPGGRIGSLSYEDLLDEPREHLTALADFIGVEPREDWLRLGIGMLDPSRRGAARRLPPAEFAALDRACEPGRTALAGTRTHLTAS
ncbi:sulfotransferase [Glycomyces luteolus]|uniref:Sulfotransferase n=1 Tax=Glycomyces luteolus TaxID=2670330 RepID=A0A9X3PLP7_9ACTN|nr:sulfotransferase [Glycomyces luteolus]MDA1360935.1 sulfotransferase [Glycomyces luteolus]